jgi:hypothetical protein
VGHRPATGFATGLDLDDVADGQQPVAEEPVEAGGEEGGFAARTVPFGFQQVAVGVEGVVRPVGDCEGIIAGGGVEPVAGDGGEQLPSW